MNLFRYVGVFFFAISFLNICGQNARFVNPFIGTGKCIEPTLWGNYGGTYPGATAPWGMVQLTPETSVRPSESGYYYEDTSIRSFSCLHHLSGYPNGSAGQLHLSFFQGRIDQLPSDFSGRCFSHQDERAEPGYYAVSFADGDKVEMAAATRSGLFCYTSPSDTITVVIWGGGKLWVRNRQTVYGSMMHSLTHFRNPFYSYRIKNDTVFLHFGQRKSGMKLMVAVSASLTGERESEMNRKVEIPDWDFDRLRKRTYAQWDKELSCVDVQSDNMEDVRQFYTALYHSFLCPMIVSDVDGTYKGKKKDSGDRYANFSPWDTFRTLHPLLSLLKPERQRDMMRSLMEEYTENGSFPKSPMTGLHYIPVMVDAYFKDAAGVEPREMWKALSSYQQMALECRDGQEYRKNGFVGAALEKSVSITTEYAYDDWVMGKLAEQIGEEGDACFSRSLNYRNLFDVESCFLLPRENNVFLRNVGELGFQESNKWTASCFAPHNVKDLIHLWGGDSCFVNWLQQSFDEGKICFDNEPVFHYPYLFTWARRPDLTRKYVHRILRTSYHNLPGGLPGNDDLGSLSSWFVFSAMGVFPACPGSGEYLLSEPLFNEIRIHRPEGTELRIIKSAYAFQGKSLPLVRLGNQNLSGWFVAHKEWMKERVLMFEKTDSLIFPQSLTLPYSMTKGVPDFKVLSAKLSRPFMYSGTNNAVLFSVKNEGESGSYVARVFEGKHLLASKRILLREKEVVEDSLSFTLYKEGEYSISFERQYFEVKVADSVQRVSPVICTSVLWPSLIRTGALAEGAFVCRNVSGRKTVSVIPVWIDANKIDTICVELEAGEEKTFPFSCSVEEVGMHNIRLLDKEKAFKVYSRALEACILDLDFGGHKSGIIPDRSGFGNDGEGQGRVRWGADYVQTDAYAYVTLPTSESLMEARETLTLLTWIAPQVPVGEHEYADFFTKGDYTLLKMEGPASLVFFAGGWGRGMCEVPVPSDWYTAWHQIAGVCTGHSLRIYIDGCCMQEIEVKGKLEATEVPWNIGRNAEMPFSRFSDMRFSRTRIYGSALSDKDIKLLYDTEKEAYHSK